MEFLEAKPVLVKTPAEVPEWQGWRDLERTQALLQWLEETARYYQECWARREFADEKDNAFNLGRVSVLIELNLMISNPEPEYTTESTDAK